jgi:hypothetical protein
VRGRLSSVMFPSTCCLPMLSSSHICLFLVGEFLNTFEFWCILFFRLPACTRRQLKYRGGGRRLVCWCIVLSDCAVGPCLLPKNPGP